jgi:hypothetical protein
MTAKQVGSAGTWRLLAAFMVACSLCAAGATRASAWPGNDNDLCAKAQHPREVSTVDPIRSRNARGDEGVWTIRACSPEMRLPGFWIRTPTELFNVREPYNVLQGGPRAASHISGGRLKLFPFVMGPEGQAVRYQALAASTAVVSAVIGAVGGFGGGVGIGVISCLAGLIPTGGISCLAIPGSAIAGIVGAIGGVISSVIENQLDRVITMASSAWDFSVPPGWKGFIIWNGFGTIGHDYIDPSFSNLWPHETPPFHVWSWFSAYPVEQGPNPDLRGSSASASTGGPITAADTNPDNLRTSRGEITRNGPDRIVEIKAAGRRIHPKQGANVLVGKGAREDLIGGPGNDVLLAAGPFDRIWSGLGDDVLVAAGRGDRLYAGSGYDELLAAGRDDRLVSGRGSDTMVSEHGTATLTAGRNSRIDVRNRRPTDTVVCPRVNRDIVIADPGDRVSRSCKYVFVNGRGTPPSPAMVGRPGFDGSHRGTRPIGP